MERQFSDSVPGLVLHRGVPSHTLRPVFPGIMEVTVGRSIALGTLLDIILGTPSRQSSAKPPLYRDAGIEFMHFRNSAYLYDGEGSITISWKPPRPARLFAIWQAYTSVESSILVSAVTRRRTSNKQRARRRNLARSVDQRYSNG